MFGTIRMDGQRAIQVTRLGPTIPSSGTFAGSNILTPTGPQKANSHTEDVEQELLPR